MQKIKQFQKEEKKKVREYENKMIDIYTKVWNRPLLIENNQYGEQDIKKNPRLADAENNEDYKQEELKETALRQKKDSRRRKINQQEY